MATFNLVNAKRLNGDSLKVQGGDKEMTKNALLG